MIFTKTKLDGAYIVEPEKILDERGFFARSWDKKLFEKKRLETKLVQFSISFNKVRGTLRGMHYQIKPYEESKIVRCTKGKIYDVIIDLRSKSKTFKKWTGVELSENNYRMMYVPKGFAHGFQTLENNTEVSYQISELYNSRYSRGIRWNDSEFSIKWPLAVKCISKKDMEYSNFNL